MTASSTTLNTIDLFAGCGGLSLGLHRAGWELLFAIEKDPMAFETFKTNFLVANAPFQAGLRWPAWLTRAPHDIELLLACEPIREQLESLRGRVALVCGGPPCQGFSVGGIRNGDDHRNHLPLRYLEFVHLVQPRAILMENVEGMARRFVSRPGEKNGHTHESQSVAEWLVQRLDEDGYDAHFQIVDASHFGVPQVRKRMILVGFRREQGFADGGAKNFFTMLSALAPEFVESKELDPSRPVTVREAIEDLNGPERVICPDSPKFESGTYKRAASTYAKLMRAGAPSPRVPDSHRFSQHGDSTLEFYKKVQSEAVFGRLPKAYLLEAGTKKDKKVLIDPDLPASTITTHPDEFIHYAHPRNITVREMARLQSFPDNFLFRGRYTINGPRRRFDVARCSQVGNAVPPFLAEAMGMVLNRILWCPNEHVEVMGGDREQGIARQGSLFEVENGLVIA